jgi:hypothetical protein
VLDLLEPRENLQRFAEGLSRYYVLRKGYSTSQDDLLVGRYFSYFFQIRLFIREDIDCLDDIVKERGEKTPIVKLPKEKKVKVKDFNYIFTSTCAFYFLSLSSALMSLIH